MSAANGFGTQLRMLIAKLDCDVQGLYDRTAVPFRPRFYPIVQHLLQHGQTPVTTLSHVIGVSQPAVTQTVGQMAKLGLVDIAAGADARQRLVGLTASGRSVAAQLRPLWDAVAAAAADLDLELPYPLSKVLASTLDALAREPFEDRIQRKMKNG